jgi:hypothetical protein
MTSHREYRERRTWAWYFGIVVVAMQAAIVAAFVPSAFSQSVLLGLIIVGMAAAVGVLLVRLVRMRVEIHDGGILVASILTTRLLPWKDIASVGYGPSRFGGHSGELALLDGSRIELVGVRTESEVREIAATLSGDVEEKVTYKADAAPDGTRLPVGVVIATPAIGLLAVAGVVVDGDRAAVYVGVFAAFTLVASRMKRR